MLACLTVHADTCTPQQAPSGTSVSFIIITFRDTLRRTSPPTASHTCSYPLLQSFAEWPVHMMCVVQLLLCCVSTVGPCAGTIHRIAMVTAAAAGTLQQQQQQQQQRGRHSRSGSSRAAVDGSNREPPGKYALSVNQVPS